jgi:hypothetical protein
MGSTSVGIEQTRTTLVVAIDEVGKGIVSYGLVLVLVWIDGMKFTLKFTSYVLAVGFSCLEVRTRYVRPGYAARILVSTQEQEQQGLEPHELVAELGWSFRIAFVTTMLDRQTQYHLCCVTANRAQKPPLGTKSFWS